MHITEIRVQLLARPASPGRADERPRADDKLRAFVRITVGDALVVRDIKLIEGHHGLFVAMPSRRLMERCGACGGKNPVGSRFCALCGARVPSRPAQPEGTRRYADICHPIHQAARAALESAVLAAYAAELERAAHPDYRPTPLDELDHDLVTLYADER